MKLACCKAKKSEGMLVEDLVCSMEIENKQITAEFSKKEIKFLNEAWVDELWAKLKIKQKT